MNIPNKNELTRIYGEAEKSAARFQAVADHFAEIYHHDIAEFLQHREEQRSSETIQIIMAAV